MKGKRRKSRKSKKWKNIRSILAIIGVLFALFNIFLVSKIKSAKDQEFQGLPHLEINYSELRDFSDVDLSIKPHNRVYDETTKKTTVTSTQPSKVDTTKELPPRSNHHSQEKHDHKIAEVKKDQEKPHVQIPRVRSSRQSESVAETVYVKSTKEAPKKLETESRAVEETLKEVAKENQPKVNPLLWQLHKKKMDGGTIQLGHLLDQHRYLMMENTTDPIPKQYMEDSAQGDIEYWIKPKVDCIGKNMVVFIKSRMESFGIRQIIRNTWASNDMVNDKQLSYIFMVGKSDSKYLNKQLETEGRDKQDILVGDFIDHYQNLTLKSMLGIQWFNNECDRSDNFMSIDDDVFPKLDQILNYIKNNDNTFNCLFNMVKHAKVTRKGKWQTNWNVYGKEFYPIYCEGACYSFHRDTAETLYEVAKRTKRDVPVDDAYITGVLREKAKIPPTQTKNKNLCSHLVNDDQIISKLKTAWQNSQK